MLLFFVFCFCSVFLPGSEGELVTYLEGVVGLGSVGAVALVVARGVAGLVRGVALDGGGVVQMPAGVAVDGEGALRHGGDGAGVAGAAGGAAGGAAKGAAVLLAVLLAVALGPGQRRGGQEKDLQGQEACLRTTTPGSQQVANR